MLKIQLILHLCVSEIKQTAFFLTSVCGKRNMLPWNLISQCVGGSVQGVVRNMEGATSNGKQNTTLQRSSLEFSCHQSFQWAITFQIYPPGSSGYGFWAKNDFLLIWTWKHSFYWETSCLVKNSHSFLCFDLSFFFLNLLTYLWKWFANILYLLKLEVLCHLFLCRLLSEVTEGALCEQWMWRKPHVFHRLVDMDFAIAFPLLLVAHLYINF